MLHSFRCAAPRPHMSNAGSRLAISAVVALASPIACGQTGMLRDPGDAAAFVPHLAYVSPMAAASGSAPSRVGSWRDANDLTGRIGGWRAYAREAQAAIRREPAASEPAPASIAPAMPKAASTPPDHPPVPMHKH